MNRLNYFIIETMGDFVGGGGRLFIARADDR